MYNLLNLLVCSSLSSILSFTFHNSRLENYVIRTVSDVGPSSCKLECYASSDCASVNYKWKTYFCEISADDRALGTVRTSKSYHYSSLADIKQEFEDPCDGIKCGPQSKCVQTFSGIHCIISECGEPYTVFNSNTTFQSSKRALGTVLTYECNNVTWPRGDLTSTCHLNGSWSNVTGRCQDKDECPDTFHHNKEDRLCIYFSNELKTWDDADNVCKTYSQRLININTPAQVTLLKNYIRSLGGVEDTDDIYIGGRLESGVYKWVATDEVIDPSVWDDGYPNSMKVCTQFHDTQHLRDKECTKLYKFACGAFY
ncbi:uncharacterized protein LOC134251521 [Saccostrea cucullata]|uniref:uncharacterized protein LOC134251521 n=1 Tax=Saccostrea cuccullata TaxID=36930 RepID=UPI002ED533CE